MPSRCREDVTIGVTWASFLQFARCMQKLNSTSWIYLYIPQFVYPRKHNRCERVNKQHHQHDASHPSYPHYPLPPSAGSWVWWLSSSGASPKRTCCWSGWRATPPPATTTSKKIFFAKWVVGILSATMIVHTDKGLGWIGVGVSTVFVAAPWTVRIALIAGCISFMCGECLLPNSARVMISSTSCTSGQWPQECNVVPPGWFPLPLPVSNRPPVRQTGHGQHGGSCRMYPGQIPPLSSCLHFYSTFSRVSILTYHSRLHPLSCFWAQPRAKPRRTFLHHRSTHTLPTHTPFALPRRSLTCTCSRVSRTLGHIMPFSRKATVCTCQRSGEWCRIWLAPGGLIDGLAGSGLDWLHL